jgi:hypothetical protein
MATLVRRTNPMRQGARASSKGKLLRSSPIHETQDLSTGNVRNLEILQPRSGSGYRENQLLGYQTFEQSCKVPGQVPGTPQVIENNELDCIYHLTQSGTANQPHRVSWTSADENDTEDRSIYYDPVGLPGTPGDPASDVPSTSNQTALHAMTSWSYLRDQIEDKAGILLVQLNDIRGRDAIELTNWLLSDDSKTRQSMAKWLDVLQSGSAGPILRSVLVGALLECSYIDPSVAHLAAAVSSRDTDLAVRLTVAEHAWKLVGAGKAILEFLANDSDPDVAEAARDSLAIDVGR